MKPSICPFALRSGTLAGLILATAAGGFVLALSGYVIGWTLLGSVVLIGTTEFVYRRAVERLLFGLDRISSGIGNNDDPPDSAFSSAIDRDSRPAGRVFESPSLQPAEAADEVVDQRLRSMLNAVPGLAFILDEDGRYVEIVATNERLLYADTLKLTGRTLHEVLPEETADEFLAVVTAALATGEPQTHTYDLTLRDGVRWFQGRCAPIEHWPGEKRAVAWFAFDVTGQVAAEAALRESEAKYAAIFRAHPDPALLYSLEDDRILAVNKGYEELFGISADEIVGKSTLSMIPFVCEDVRERGMNILRAQGRMAGEEFTITTKDGDSIVIQVFAEPFEVACKPCFVIIVRDVTEERAAKARLDSHRRDLEKVVEERTRDFKLSEEKYRSVVESSPDTIFTVDRDGIVLYVNHVVEGLTKEEVVGMPIYPFAPEAYREEQERTVNSVFESGKNASIETCSIGPNGTDAWYSTRVSPVRRDGEIVAATIVVSDITDRIEAEEKIKESRDFAEGLINTMQDGFVALDRRLTNIGVNEAFCRMSGYSRTELLGGSPPFPYWQPHKEEFVRSSFESVHEGEQQSFELTLRKKNGETIPVLVSPSILRDNEGDIVSHFATIKDISQIKKAEAILRSENVELEERVRLRTVELEAANKELEAFSYSVSHDLRSPLRTIDGFSSILINEFAGDLPEMGAHYLERIRENIGHMNHLVDDLLDLSRRSRQILRTTSVNPTPLVREVIDELRAECEDRRVEFEVEELPRCRADASLLKHVFLNLLSNAVKYTRQVDIARIHIAATSANGVVTYAVTDNGIGFDMLYADKIFGVFQRLHRAEEFSGTGVGLAIVQRIVSRHGGHIWVDSVPGEGTSFYFTLTPDRTYAGQTDRYPGC